MAGEGKKSRRTIDDVFGEDLPQASSDEREPETRGSDGDRDSWLRQNVPPHHA